jgi:hypothetical protein
MPKIIEIWRKAVIPGAPVRFTVGHRPQTVVDNELATIEDAPVVKSINFYVGGAFNGKAYRDECYVVQFEDTDVRRVLAYDTIGEIAYDSESTKIKAVKAQLEDHEEQKANTPDLPEG